MPCPRVFEDYKALASEFDEHISADGNYALCFDFPFLSNLSLKQGTRCVDCERNEFSVRGIM